MNGHPTRQETNSSRCLYGLSAWRQRLTKTRPLSTLKGTAIQRDFTRARGRGEVRVRNGRCTPRATDADQQPCICQREPARCLHNPFCSVTTGPIFAALSSPPPVAGRRSGAEPTVAFTAEAVSRCVPLGYRIRSTERRYPATMASTTRRAKLAL
jgi:hypothetical protein